ncbi:MAG: homoserine kinase [Actinomycetes bacterium]
MAFWEQPVTVRVPATSANLGPGFDSMGLALELFDEVSAVVTSGVGTIVVEGEGAGELALDDSHLVIATMHKTFAAMNIAAPIVGLHCVNAIPQARGLGSSSAAIVAGALLARGLVVDGDQLLSDQDLLQFVVDLEGHPDNVAPCLLGGLVLSWGNPVHSLNRQIHESIKPTVFISAFNVKTEHARAILPDHIWHHDAAMNSARAALLMDALTRDPSNLFDATVDYLHQEQRRPAMPASVELMDRLRLAGVPATISGAGPSVLALAVSAEHETAIAQIASASPDFSALALPVSPAGAAIISG